MIKLISPKYLGTRTSEGVKQRVIELLYSWTRQMPQVGGVVLPLDLTDALGGWRSCSTHELDRCHR